MISLIPAAHFFSPWIFYFLLTAIVPSLVTSELLGSDRVLLACGNNENTVNDAFRNISDRATALRNGINCSFNHDSSQGAMGLVKQVIFDDGSTWAVKIVEKKTYPWVYEGFRSLDVIQRYCPHLPVAKQYGEVGSLANDSLKYYFMEWKEGRDLGLECFRNKTRSSGVDGGEATFSIPEGLVSRLAEFVYNLTTCPIPQAESSPLN